ncbi:MAG: hypothetical protein WBY44_30030 [Bryobacteraceae bacterium]
MARSDFALATRLKPAPQLLQQFLNYYATQQLGILEDGKPNTVDEFRQDIRGFNDVLQVQGIRPHKRTARRASRTRGCEA